MKLLLVLSSAIEEVGDPFSNLESESLQRSYIESHFTHVKPHRIVCGKILKRMKSGNKFLIKEKEETFMYISMLDSLKQLFGNSRIRQIVLKKPHTCEPNVYYDLCDGSIYQEDVFFQAHPEALIIIIYHDELEVCNPLGSNAGIHKLDMFYYTIGNLSPKFRSKHSAVKLLAVANANLIKKYGIDVVVDHIVEDMLFLHNGYRFDIEGCQITVHGKVLVATGDTLGQHLWGGFKEGVGFAFQKCRQCYCDFDSMQESFFPSSFVYRNKRQYDQQCHEIETAPTKAMAADLKCSYGINKRSPLTRLPSFDVTKQLPHDIMHILLEGTVQFEMRLVLKHFIDEGIVSLLEINGSLISHNYGYSEVQVKPNHLRESVFSRDEKYKLKLKAKQTHLFLRLFSFIIGPLVDMDDQYFQFIVDLMEIVHIIFSPVIHKETALRLETMIAEHLMTFKELFPDTNLLPKHHYLIHIPTSILKFGPPIRYSCFSFESYHNYFKRLATTQNFKNLLSLAKRHQYLETCNNSFENPSSHPLFASEKQYGVLRELKTETKYQLRQDFNRCGILPGLSLDNLVNVSWVIRYETKYNKNGIVAIGSSKEQLPVFGVILNIYFVFEYVYFQLKLLKTVSYERSYLSYQVEKNDTDDLFYCSYDSLLDYNVFHMKFGKHGESYVPTNYSLNDIIKQHLNGNNPLHS